MAGNMKLGGGGRFQALESKIEGEGKSPESAKAIAASAGIHKYGAGKMSAMAHRARMKAAKHMGHKS